MALVVTCLAFGVRAGRVALCVTGAVRTFVEPQVYESLARFASPRGDVDVHYHLFVGRELSYRGQARRVTAAALTPAVANAVSLRLQFTENGYTCGQMTTGKFYKIASCAAQVAAYAAAQPATAYDVFAFARPDLAYQPDKRLAVLAAVVRQGRVLNWDELAVMPYDDGRSRAATLPAARCCDIVRRQPRECFIWTRNSGHEIAAPRANFIQARHLHASSSSLPPCPGDIVRPKGYKSQNKVWLHNRTRDDVGMMAAPALSSLKLDLRDLDAARQLTAVARAFEEGAAAWNKAMRPAG